MPFLCLQTNAIPDGVIQVTDVTPNVSQAGELAGAGQSRYVRRVENATVVTAAPVGGALDTVGDLRGLAAYLIDNVDVGGVQGGAALTAAEANAAAGLIIARMDAGAACGATEINADLAAQQGGTTINGGGSTGSVVDVLSILSGRGYSVPAGSRVQAGGAKVAGRLGGFLHQVTSQGSTGGPNRPAPVIQINQEVEAIREQILSASLLASAGAGEINGFEQARDLNAMSGLANDSDIPAVEEVSGVTGVQIRTYAPPFARAKLTKNRLNATLQQTVLVLYADDGTILT